VNFIHIFQYINHYVSRGRICSGTSCHYSVEELLPSCLLSETLNVQNNNFASCFMGVENGLVAFEMFQNKVLRKMYGPKNNEIVEHFKTSHNEELHDLYRSPGILMMVKSRRL
jgi:hypothetical protein